MKNRHTDNLRKTNHNAIITHCYYDHLGRLETKIEQYSGLQDRYNYLWNNENRLLSVRCNDILQEEYLYNSKGLRIRQKRYGNSATQHTDGPLYYDKRGKLLQAGKTLYGYDGLGRMVEKKDANGLTRFVYQAGSNKIILPGGHEVVYQYARNTPRKRLRDGILSASYTWRADNRLDSLYDYDYGLLWNFTYHQEGWPVTAIVSVLDTALPHLQIEDNAKREQLRELISGCGGIMFLNCGCDHNGTLKVLTSEDSLLFMKNNMDSFGNIHDNGLAGAPLGFMNGLVDRDTGLVLFGAKFYDPAIAGIINISDKNQSIAAASSGIVAMDNNNWDESEHPRDKQGKFTAKGGGGNGRSNAEAQREHDTKYPANWEKLASFETAAAGGGGETEIQQAHMGEMELWGGEGSAARREGEGQNTHQKDIDFYRSAGSKQADLMRQLRNLLSNGNSDEDSEKQFTALLAELKNLNKEISAYHSPSSAGAREAEKAYNSELRRLRPIWEKIILVSLAAYGGADFQYVAESIEAPYVMDTIFQQLIFSLADSDKQLSLEQAKRLANDLTMIHVLSGDRDRKLFPFTTHPPTHLGSPDMIKSFVKRIVINEDLWDQVVEILNNNDHQQQLKAWVIKNNQ